MEVPAQLAGRLFTPAERRNAALAAVALAGGVAVAVAAALGAAGAGSNPVLLGAARGLIVGAPIAIGVHSCLHPSRQRFGVLLIATGGALFVTTFAESTDALAYTVGRTAGWLAEVLIVYVTLAFPTGRLSGRADRVIVAAMAVVVATLFLPRLVLASGFEVPSPYTSCVHDCPANALFALGTQPGVVADVLGPLGVLAVFAIMACVVIRLVLRSAGESRIARRMFAGVVIVAAARAALVGIGFIVRMQAPGSAITTTIAWLIALSIPALALAFLVGLLQWRLFAAKALARLGACLDAVPDPPTLRRAFADAFADPSIEIVFPMLNRPGHWTDPDGEPVAPPAPGSRRTLSEVRGSHGLVAGLVHEEALDAYPDLLHAGTAMAGVALDNQRLVAQARTTLQELRESRARISTSAERERRRIERDLHDGAQQQLVALRIELGLAEDLVRRDPELGLRRLALLEQHVDDALEDLRSLAHGVYPSLLADRGLTEALRTVTSRSAIPVDLVARDVWRYSPEVESAVYFCVREALQNALKHAAGAQRVTVEIDGSTHGELRFCVRDDGVGAPDGVIAPGSGVTNMRDRLGAVDGEVDIVSTPYVGTTVRGCIPTVALRQG